MLSIAHRGEPNSEIKENTWNAFKNAFNNNAIWIECDLRFNSKG